MLSPLPSLSTACSHLCLLSALHDLTSACSQPVDLLPLSSRLARALRPTSHNLQHFQGAVGLIVLVSIILFILLSLLTLLKLLKLLKQPNH
jgi:hypothetical protein